MFTLRILTSSEVTLAYLFYEATQALSHVCYVLRLCMALQSLLAKACLHYVVRFGRLQPFFVCCEQCHCPDTR